MKDFLNFSDLGMRSEIWFKGKERVEILLSMIIAVNSKQSDIFKDNISWSGDCETRAWLWLKCCRSDLDPSEREWDTLSQILSIFDYATTNVLILNFGIMALMWPYWHQETKISLKHPPCMLTLFFSHEYFLLCLSSTLNTRWKLELNI